MSSVRNTLGHGRGDSLLSAQVSMSVDWPKKECSSPISSVHGNFSTVQYLSHNSYGAGFLLYLIKNEAVDIVPEIYGCLAVSLPVPVHPVEIARAEVLPSCHCELPCPWSRCSSAASHSQFGVHLSMRKPQSRRVPILSSIPWLGRLSSCWETRNFALLVKHNGKDQAEIPGQWPNQV